MSNGANQQNFVEKALSKWREALKSIGGSEIDERQAFSNQILEGLLGYDHTKGDYQSEERGTFTDIAVYDKQHYKVIAIETKRSDKTIDSKETIDQAFSYATSFTRYVGLSNLKEFRLYKNDKNRKLIAQINFETIFNRGLRIDKLEKGLLANEYANIDILRFISKEEIYDDEVFDNFEEGYHAASVTDATGFADLIRTLEKCIAYLYGYALRSFNEYENRLQYYDETNSAISKHLEDAIRTKDQDLAYKLRMEQEELRRNFENYVDFRNGFETWKLTSQRVYKEADEFREAFCREAAYVLLNKVLFIRICEDKKLLSKKISNGGIAKWQEFTEFLKENYKDLLSIAYSDASHLYDHIYQRGIFDWYQYGNSELNDILKRIFWNLNHFNFTDVDKDIIGHIYERYLSPDQRKALGEFYTPPEIVKYILNSVNYKAENEEIRGHNIIDLGCGSGGFLVEALNRLLQSCERASIPDKNTLQVAIQNIYGFDIDHFAVHISEMNLAFRIVDIYKKAKTDDKDFVLPRLKIYQTNSLKFPEQKKQSRLYSTESLYIYLKENEEVDKLKAEKFTFVVGNPPYVTKQLSSDDRKYYLMNYKDSIYNRPNLYRLFIHRASMLLEEDGLLGFIVPNTWIADTYASQFRRYLRENFRILLVIQLPEKAKAFYKVTQATTILILKKDTKGKENYSFKLGVNEVEDLAALDSIAFVDRNIGDVAFGQEDAYKFVLSPYDLTYSFIKKIRENSDFLDAVVDDVQSGEIRQVDVKDSIFEESADGRQIVIHGDNIDPFFIDSSSGRKDSMWYQPPQDKVSRDEHSLRNRIVLQRISNMTLKKRIRAALLEVTDKPMYVENGANYILFDSQKADAKYLLGLLNSSTLNSYIKLFSSNNNIQPSELKRLPIKKISEENKPIADSIREKVDQITKLKYDILKYRSIVQSPSSLITNGQSIYNASISKYPSTNLKGAIRPHRAGNQLYVSVADYFECENEDQAKVLEFLILQLNDLSEIPNLKLPKTREQTHEFVLTYQEAINSVGTYQARLDLLERELDKLVYGLYELSSTEIDLIENKAIGFTEPLEEE
jgi:type I restriction-modification system DNA methylase subunit